MKRASAFEEYAREVTPSLGAYLARRTWPATGEVDDLVEETLLVAWRRFEYVPQEHEARIAWTIGVGRNVLRNATRAKMRRAKAEGRYEAQGKAGIGPATSGASAEERVVATATVRAALDSLEEDEREVLTLAAWEGLSNAVIGTVLGISTGAAATRLSRAKAHFRAALAGQDATVAVTA